MGGLRVVCCDLIFPSREAPEVHILHFGGNVLLGRRRYWIVELPWDRSSRRWDDVVQDVEKGVREYHGSKANRIRRSLRTSFLRLWRPISGHESHL
jgi:hypothetical protein